MLITYSTSIEKTSEVKKNPKCEVHEEYLEWKVQASS